MRASLAILALVASLGLPSREASAAFDDLPPSKRAGYTALAVVENTVPITSALVAPRCLQGYVLCKLTFAGLALLTAGEQLLMSGGADLGQTRTILHRGFAGDWIVTPRHAAGDLQPQVLPDPPPAAPAADAVP
jgi:hypothetical protein